MYTWLYIFLALTILIIIFRVFILIWDGGVGCPLGGGSTWTEFTWGGVWNGGIGWTWGGASIRELDWYFFIPPWIYPGGWDPPLTSNSRLSAFLLRITFCGVNVLEISSCLLKCLNSVSKSSVWVWGKVKPLKDAFELKVKYWLTLGFLYTPARKSLLFRG